MQNKKVTTELAQHYHHIDNGGPSISVNTTAHYNPKEDVPFRIQEIVMSSTYNGYASVEAKITGFEIDSTFMRNAALALLEAANELGRIIAEESGK